MRVFSRFLVIISLSVLALSGCATSELKPLNVLPIAPNLTMPLPQLSDMKRSLEVAQLITVHYQNEQLVFEGHISITPERFVMVGLDAFGRKAITIRWTKEGVMYESASFVPTQLRPENILADIVLLYWPKNSLQRALEGSSAKLISSKNKRVLMQGNQKILEADYQPNSPYNFWDGKLHYRHFVWGYDMDIQSVEIAP